MNNSDRSSKSLIAFKLFDMNKDGYITREEFKKVHLVISNTVKLYPCLKVSKKLDSTQIEAVFKRFDVNKDGRLSMDEFRRLMEKR